MIGSERLYLCKTLEMLIAREYGDDDAETEICGELSPSDGIQNNP